jgi:DNA-binding HxlR family transcriptional regulator
MMIFLFLRCKREPEVIFQKSIPDIPNMDTHLQRTRFNGGDYMGESVGRMDRVLLDQISGQWDLLILSALCDHEGRARFNALKRSVPGISQKMLTQCLRQLERSGLVVRLVLTESPVGVEYSLTKLGETLGTPVTALCQWTSEHSAAVRDAQKSFDAKKVTHKSNASR